MPVFFSLKFTPEHKFSHVFPYLFCPFLFFRYLTDDSMGFLEVSVGEKLEVLEISFNGSFTDSGRL